MNGEPLSARLRASDETGRLGMWVARVALLLFHVPFVAGGLLGVWLFLGAIASTAEGQFGFAPLVLFMLVWNLGWWTGVIESLRASWPFARSSPIGEAESPPIAASRDATRATADPPKPERARERAVEEPEREPFFGGLQRTMRLGARS
jgi:hypothetical protein